LRVRKLAFYRPYRTMQRLKTLERCQKLTTQGAYNFTVVFSATEAVRAALLEEFFLLLGKAQQLVGKSADEDVYQLNFDLFDWSR
jgi:hypothetical protein